MLTSVAELVHLANRDSVAIGAFNISNLEMALGIIRAAVDSNTPVIIQVSETTIEYAGLKPITHIVETIAKNAAVTIPVALHLDHGKSFRSVAECIHAGFSSIMIDASDLPYDENVVLTQQSVAYAHKHNVWAQGELGQVKAAEDAALSANREQFMTDPDEAASFVAKTGVDTLAVAVGNVHGVYKFQKGVPKLDIKRLEAIHKKIPNTPLVLHGASGLPAEQVALAITNGVRVINIDTEVHWVFSETLRHTVAQFPDYYDVRMLLEPSIEAVRKLVSTKLSMFGRPKSFTRKPSLSRIRP
jgi:fructose-bisphosphate aldolase class II